MSYDIYIGNAVIAGGTEDDEGEYRVTVEGHAEPEAPVFPFDGATRNGNSRHPGYVAWSDWTKAVGLWAFFFDDECGLMRRHPGTFALTAAHLATVRQALADYRARHPTARPGWDWHPTMPQARDDGVRGRDPALARLLWLDWWVAWALATCERPAIHNH